jgi:acyl-ACP thioesterase
MSPEAEDKKAGYARSFSVRTYESDHHGLLRPEALLNYFQEAAADHAERLGAGVVALLKRRLTWVLSRYHIRLVRYPRWKETVELTTWPGLTQGLFALREFEARDEKGEILAAATSSWMLIDFKTNRPVPPGEHLEPYVRDPRRAVASDFATLPTVVQAEMERSFRVRMSDLDWNRHVNHVAYVGWALETAAPEFLESHRPSAIEADFRGQAFSGQTVLCRMQPLSTESPLTIAYQIIRVEDRKELARLRIAWQD